MKKLKTLKNEENLTSETTNKKTYHFIGSNGEKIHKTKEEFKKEHKIIVYPYSITNRFGLTTPKIKQIEFRGWNSITEIPSDFKMGKGYGFKSQRSKVFLSYIRRRFPKARTIIVQLNGKTEVGTEIITFNWADLLEILRTINREKDQSTLNRKLLIEEHLSELTSKIRRPKRKFSPGDLETYLGKFGSFDELSPRDIDSLTNLIGKLPTNKIKITSHFIETRDKMDIVYIEDVIDKFKKLMIVKTDNEEQWQQFFSKNSWILTHLFSYQVILKKGKAYVGGKTIENVDGTIVDFLFESGFKDNFALLEIKTHLKNLLKEIAYRNPDVFALSDDLSGGINQCLDQKDHFIKDFGKIHQTFDPTTILIIGKKASLTAEQTKCFELLRSNQKNVDIVTFDELLAKLEGLHKVLVGE